MSGWIKLHRSLLDWEWWDDANATRLLIYLLCAVNYEDKKWKGVNIRAGSIVTSYDKLSSATGLTYKQVRVALNKLIEGREVERKRAHEGQLITLVKWDKLQSVKDSRAVKGQSVGQFEGSSRATTKEYKEIEEERSAREEKNNSGYGLDGINLMG